jgi:hypothetical protein
MYMHIESQQEADNHALLHYVHVGTYLSMQQMVQQGPGVGFELLMLCS